MIREQVTMAYIRWMMMKDMPDVLLIEQERPYPWTESDYRQTLHLQPPTPQALCNHRSYDLRAAAKNDWTAEHGSTPKVSSQRIRRRYGRETASQTTSGSARQDLGGGSGKQLGRSVVLPVAGVPVQCGFSPGVRRHERGCVSFSVWTRGVDEASQVMITFNGQRIVTWNACVFAKGLWRGWLKVQALQRELFND